MNRSYIFWLAAALGVLAGIYLYFRYVDKKEHFAVNIGNIGNIGNIEPKHKPSEKNGGKNVPNKDLKSIDDCPAGTFVEKVENIPYHDKMKVYLSSFSTSVHDRSRAPYCPNMLRWYDIRNIHRYFNINTIAPPANIEGAGLSTKNVILVGPPSHNLAGDKVFYELKPFTLFFYAALETPNFTEDKVISIFRIYAETPNSLYLVLRPSETQGNTQVVLVLGNDRSKYIWDITTSTLTSNKNPTLYALTVNTTPNSDNVATLYIGKSRYTANLKIDTRIKLGNTRMEINTLGNLDSKLYSFGFIDHKLTEAEIDKLGEYMARQQTGVDREAAIAAQKAKETADKTVHSLKQQLAETSSIADRYSSTNEIIQRNVRIAERKIQRERQAHEERQAQRKKEDEERARQARRNAARQEREQKRLEAEKQKEHKAGTREEPVRWQLESTVTKPVIPVTERVMPTVSNAPIPDTPIAPPSMPPPRPDLSKEPTAAPRYKNNDYNISTPATIEQTLQAHASSSVLENTSLSSARNEVAPPIPKSVPIASDGSKTMLNQIRYTLNSLVSTP